MGVECEWFVDKIAALYMLVIYLKDCNCIATILKVLIFYIAQRKCIYKAVKCALLKTVTVDAENTVAR